MLKKTITYEDYNGETITEDFYFNLNKAELIQMQFDANGAYSEFLNRIVNERDIKKLGEEFKNIILSAYGRKSDDGRRFIKSPAMREEFEQTEAFSNLYVDLLGNTEAMNAFLTGVIPKDLVATSKPALESAN